MTKLSSIQNLMLPLIPDDYKTDIQSDITLCVLGVAQAGVLLGKTFKLINETIEVDGKDEIITCIEDEMTSSEIYLCAMCSYKAYLLKLKDEFNRDAINFKTLTFEIKSLEKRPEALNDSIYSVNKDINSMVALISGSNSLVGVAKSFCRDGYFKN